MPRQSANTNAQGSTPASSPAANTPAATPAPTPAPAEATARMGKVPYTETILQKLHDAGAIQLKDGKAFLMVESTTKDAEGKEVKKTFGINVKEIRVVTEWQVDRYIAAHDKETAARVQYRKQSEKMLLDGLLPDTGFDAIFGAGEAAKVREAAKPAS